MFGSPETTPGGRALKFYSSVRLDIRRIESIKDGAEIVGNRTRVKVVKNKVAPPFRQAEFDIMYGKGISREGTLLDIAVDMGIIKKSGAWFTYEGEQLGQGRENAKSFLGRQPRDHGRGFREGACRGRPRPARRSRVHACRRRTHHDRLIMSVPARLSLVALGVADVARATSFYEALGWQRSSASNDDVSFFQLGGLALSVFGRQALAEDAMISSQGSGFTGISLAINLESEDEVDRVAAEWVSCGGTMIKAPQRVFWGGYSGYVADPDGHMWELAFNPGFPLLADGSIQLPTAH